MSERVPDIKFVADMVSVYRLARETFWALWLAAEYSRIEEGIGNIREAFCVLGRV